MKDSKINPQAWLLNAGQLLLALLWHRNAFLNVLKSSNVKRQKPTVVSEAESSASSRMSGTGSIDTQTHLTGSWDHQSNTKIKNNGRNCGFY